MQFLSTTFPTAVVAVVVAGFFISVVAIAIAEVRQAWRASHAGVTRS